MTDSRFRDPSDLDTLDDFLAEDGIREAVTLRAVKSVIALQLRQAMKDRNLTLSAMAAEMDTSRAAKAVGRGLRVELV